MNVSVIIPFYKGEKYVNRLIFSLENSANKYEKKYGYHIEIIVINDYPDPNIDISSYFINCKLNVSVYNNKVNSGIQQSRVNGLFYSNYDFVLFLDQDDLISEDYFINQFENINGSDVVICNGIDEREDDSKIIYKTKSSIKYATKEIGYLKVRDLIVSPGQCIIRKECIPKYWKENIMRINCADDYFLWLLMFDAGCIFSFNYSKDFIHKFTGNNLSCDLDYVNKSNLEMVQLLKYNRFYSRKKLKFLIRNIDFKYKIYCKTLGFDILRYLDLFLYNLIYQMFWKGM